MDPYVIKQGESLSKLAFQRGFDASTVWSDPANAELAGKRKNMDVLCPGDIVYLPPVEPTTIPVAVGSSNPFGSKVPEVPITLKLKKGGEPIADAAYRVDGLGAPVEGKTGGDGSVTVSVTILTREITIVLTELGLEYQVMIGDLDPHDEPSGIKMRLANLGYLGADITRITDDFLKRAIAAFQSVNGLPVTGEADQATIDALEGAHGH